MSDRHVWGFWDCNYCGNKHIRGDNDSCPSCGHSRDADVKYYIDTNNIVEVSADKKNDKANWICAFCGSQNEDKNTICDYCGASKADSEANYFEAQRQIKEQNASLSAAFSTPDSDSTAVKYSPMMFLQKHRRTIVTALLSILVVALIGGVLAWLFTPVHREMTIDSFEWERSIGIEELRTYNESGWSLPSDARLQYTNREIRSYNHVIDHYETKTRTVTKQRITGYEEYVVGYDDLGNGQFRERTATRPVYETYDDTETYQVPVYRDDPVYDTKYYYEIDRWTNSRSVKTSGNDKAPYWGEVVLGQKERRGSSSENYYISGIIEGKSKHFKLAFADWQQFNAGDTLTFRTFRFGNNILEIEGVSVLQSEE